MSGARRAPGAQARQSATGPDCIAENCEAAAPASEGVQMSLKVSKEHRRPNRCFPPPAGLAATQDVCTEVRGCPVAFAERPRARMYLHKAPHLEARPLVTRARRGGRDAGVAVRSLPLARCP
jgi:hypothetical protein